MVELTTGGTIPVSEYGFVANDPDINLFYTGTGRRTLYIGVVSDDDALAPARLYISEIDPR
ncbi:MAG: hypothetical protein EA422_02980 [Gemmatimonadales bacterium]|nr:MAG: hypothetical protein EA422_02980 [Gemmatimonadales bacterium]